MVEELKWGGRERESWVLDYSKGLGWLRNFMKRISLGAIINIG